MRLEVVHLRERGLVPLGAAVELPRVVVEREDVDDVDEQPARGLDAEELDVVVGDRHLDAVGLRGGDEVAHVVAVVVGVARELVLDLHADHRPVARAADLPARDARHHLGVPALPRGREVRVDGPQHARAAEHPVRVAAAVDLALHVRARPRHHVQPLVARQPQEAVEVVAAVPAEPPRLDLVELPRDVDRDRVQPGRPHLRKHVAPHPRTRHPERMHLAAVEEHALALDLHRVAVPLDRRGAARVAARDASASPVPMTFRSTWLCCHAVGLELLRLGRASSSARRSSG